MEIIYKDLGIIKFKDAFAEQEKIFNTVISDKLLTINSGDTTTNHLSLNSNHCKHHLLFCEHPHTYTLGNSGNQNNLLISEDFLRKIDAEFYKTNRGGDITYHGPGQIVGYPIFDIEAMNLGIKDYIELLEESIINTLLEFEIKSERLSGATGVWLDTVVNDKRLMSNPIQNSKFKIQNDVTVGAGSARPTTNINHLPLTINHYNPRKICAIGVRASRYVTMHGFALNVNTNLDYFRYINPCGFVDKSVTSMENELGTKQNMEAVKTKLFENIIKIFCNLVNI